jgi:hypothetical protein
MSNRWLNCVRVNAGESCRVAGSCSVVPIERALLNYCSDMVNLQALYTGDRAALNNRPRKILNFHSPHEVFSALTADFIKGVALQP